MHPVGKQPVVCNIIPNSSPNCVIRPSSSANVRINRCFPFSILYLDPLVHRCLKFFHHISYFPLFSDSLNAFRTSRGPKRVILKWTGSSMLVVKCMRGKRNRIALTTMWGRKFRSNDSFGPLWWPESATFPSVGFSLLSFLFVLSVSIYFLSRSCLSL